MIQHLVLHHLFYNSEVIGIFCIVSIIRVFCITGIFSRCIFGCTCVNGFFGIFVSVFDTVTSPFSSLLRRDEALRELSQNYWTGVFEPALPSYLSQQRKLPIVIGGGLAVAALQFMGCPIYAAALTMIGLTVTGRSFPDLWAMSNIAPLAAPYGGQGAGMWMSTPTPPLAYL